MATNTKQLLVVVFRCSFTRQAQAYWRSVVAQFSKLLTCLLRSSNRFNSTRYSSYSWLRLFKDLEEVKAAVTGSLSIMSDYTEADRLTEADIFYVLAIGSGAEPTDCGTVCFWGCRSHASACEEWRHRLYSLVMTGWCVGTVNWEWHRWELTVDRHWPDGPTAAAAAVTCISSPYFNIVRTIGFDIIRKFQCFISFK